MLKISFLLASWRPMTKIAGSGSGSGSISQMHGSEDPDPDPPQYVMDPEHWFRENKISNLTKVWIGHKIRDANLDQNALKFMDLGPHCEYETWTVHGLKRLHSSFWENVKILSKKKSSFMEQSNFGRKIQKSRHCSHYYCKRRHSKPRNPDLNLFWKSWIRIRKLYSIMHTDPQPSIKSFSYKS